MAVRQKVTIGEGKMAVIIRGNRGGKDGGETKRGSKK